MFVKILVMFAKLLLVKLLIGKMIGYLCNSKMHSQKAAGLCQV